MKKRTTILLSILMTSFILLSGCSGTNANPSSSAASAADRAPLYDWGQITGETLTVWGDKNDLERPYLIRAFENYEKATGNTINAVPLSKEDLNTTVPNAFSSNDAQKPDVLFYYGGTNLDSLNPSENFYDFTQAPWVDDLIDTALNQAIYDSKVVGLPHGEASVSGTLYNKEIFKKYDIEIPKNQEEFLLACETLLKNGIIPMYLPYAEITMLLYQFPMDSILQDSKVLNGLNDGSLSYSQIPEMQKIIDWYKTMSDRGYFGQDYKENDWAGMDGALNSGKYAMMLCWDTWIYNSFSGKPDTLGIMPAFMGVPEEGCFEGANVILALVNKKGPRVDLSLDLINFLADPYNYNMTFQGLHTAPIFKNQVGNIATAQYMEAELLIDKLFYNSTAWSRVKGFAQIDAEYIQKYMQGEISAKECLDALDAARIKRAGIDLSKALTN